MCQEVRGVGAIDFVYRGSRVIIGTAFDRPLIDSGCKFCGACVEVCPTGALIDKGGKLVTEAEREAFLVPCRHACPLGIDVPRYVRLISEGKYSDALAVISEKTPFPLICGTVCHHPCETKCRRGEVNEPIAIRALKRFVAERPPIGGVRRIRFVPPSGKRVAIVGSGLAGLTAAYYLTRLCGHSVTVFEALPEPGGMLRYGTPEYRLPKKVLDSEIDLVRDSGVEIRTSTKVSSLDELFDQGYDAVFLALGAHRGTKLGVEGEDSPGVFDGVTFLRNVNSGEQVNVGDKVAVVGGGNVAMDSARTVLRLGAREVTVIYCRTIAEMPASLEEFQGAKEEGVNMVFLAAPVKIIPRDRGLRLTCIRTELGEPDASGQQCTAAIKGSEFHTDFNTIIVAIGRIPDIPEQFGLEVGRGNTLQVDTGTLATSRQGVFAGGDVVTGAATVTEAMAAGKKAAISIDKYLGGSGNIDETLTALEEASPCLGMEEDFGREPRQQMSCLNPKERLNNFAQVELGFSEEVAAREARRCLRCDLRLRIGKPKTAPVKEQVEEILASYAT